MLRRKTGFQFKRGPALCGDHGIASESSKSCFMGVDQGKDLHVVIAEKLPEKGVKIVHLGIYRDWPELDRLMENFGISLCVVDGLPEMMPGPLPSGLRAGCSLVFTMRPKSMVISGTRRN